MLPTLPGSDKKTTITDHLAGNATLMCLLIYISISSLPELFQFNANVAVFCAHAHTQKGRSAKFDLY